MVLVLVLCNCKNHDTSVFSSDFRLKTLNKYEKHVRCSHHALYKLHQQNTRRKLWSYIIHNIKNEQKCPIARVAKIEDLKKYREKRKRGVSVGPLAASQ